jgi:hypothetical protein
MRKLLILTAALTLGACANLDTPEEKYFATVAAVKAAGDAAETYVLACKEMPADHGCRDKFPAIHGGAKALKAASKQADKVFVEKSSTYYNLSFSAVDNAIMNLKRIIGE